MPYTLSSQALLAPSIHYGHPRLKGNMYVVLNGNEKYGVFYITFNDKTPYIIGLPSACPLTISSSSGISSGTGGGSSPGACSSWPFTDRMKPISRKANKN